MLTEFREIFKLPVTLLLILLMLPIAPTVVSARKKRYKKEYVRKQALETIQKNSETLSELAGLQSMVGDSLDFDLDTNDPDYLQEGEIIEELELEDDVTVDIEVFKTMWLSFVTDDENEEFTSAGIKKSEMMDAITEWLGTRYRYGGTSSRGIDCSAFVRQIFRESGDLLLPRTARTQINIGDKVTRKNLEFGDLVFFHTRRRYYVSHVGLYLGDDLFVHASSRYGVTVSSLESKYYNKRFIGARRITVDDIARFSIHKEEKITSKEN